MENADHYLLNKQEVDFLKLEFELIMMYNEYQTNADNESDCEASTSFDFEKTRVYDVLSL